MSQKHPSTVVSRVLSLSFVIACALLILSVGDGARAALIDFDHDAAGNTLTAPDLFTNTVRLTELYAPLGVHFAGPGGNNGGAILNQGGNFGVSALSGLNFLAFNRQSVMSDGGIPTDPETIRFDVLMLSVSIFAAGGSDVNTFEMRAFGAGGNLLTLATVTSQTFSQMTVSSAAGIARVELREVSPVGDNAFVYDNLSFTPVPEPGTWLLLALSLAGIVASRRRRWL